MDFSKEMKKGCQTWVGIVAVTLLLIIIVFALFNTSKPGKKMLGTAGKIEAEDLMEQQMKARRHITIKDGKQLVVF